MAGGLILVTDAGMSIAVSDEQSLKAFSPIDASVLFDSKVTEASDAHP